LRTKERKPLKLAKEPKPEKPRQSQLPTQLMVKLPCHPHLPMRQRLKSKKLKLLSKMMRLRRVKVVMKKEEVLTNRTTWLSSQ